MVIMDGLPDGIGKDVYNGWNREGWLTDEI